MVDKRHKLEMADVLIAWMLIAKSNGYEFDELFELAVRKMAEKHLKAKGFLHPVHKPFLTVE